MFASIIIASKNEGSMLRRTLDSIQQAPCGIAHEIIVVDDGSVDGSCDFLRGASLSDVKLIRAEGIGLAPARNLGAAHAQGDILVFCDAHIAVDPHWLDHLAGVMRDEGADAVCPALAAMDPKSPRRASRNVMNAARSAILSGEGMCGKTMVSLLVSRWLPLRETAVEVPVLCGGCWAVTQKAFETVGGYEPAFRSYGWDEEEISIKLWTFGFVLKAVPYTCVRHQFRLIAPYQVKGADVLYNLLYLSMCHYRDERVARLMDELSNYSATKDLAWQLLLEVFSANNIKTKRELYRRKRLHSDDWFFEKFNLPL